MASDAELFQRFDAVCRRKEGDAAGGGAAHSMVARPAAIEACADFEPIADWAIDDADVRQWLSQRRVFDAQFDELLAECQGDFLRPVLSQPSRSWVSCPVLRPMPASQLDELRAVGEAEMTESTAFEESLWGNLSRLRKRVRALGQNSYSCSRPGQLQVIAQDIKREFEAFKAQQRNLFEALAMEEAALTDGLDGCGRRFNAWSAAAPYEMRLQEGGATSSSPAVETARPRSASRSFQTGNTNTSSSPCASPVLGNSSSAKATVAAMTDVEIDNIKKAIEELDAEDKKSGGATGGWTATKHDEFLRIYRIYKCVPTAAFYVRMQERYGNEFDNERVKEHVDWFEGQERRRIERRQLFAKWRERRAELERESQQREQEKEDCDAQARQQNAERDKQKQTEERQKIFAWRKDRSEEEERAANIRQQIELGRHRKADEERRRQHLAQRDAVDAYRRQKEVDRARSAEAASAAEGSSKRRAMSVEDRNKIEKRRQDHVKRKVAAQQQARAEAEARERMAASKSRVYDSIESRLYDTTESYIQKIVSKPPEAPFAVDVAPPTDRLPPRPPSGAFRRPSSAHAMRMPN